eukprot:scaffold14744_cov98-Skeletonema_marinoi.AAC.2
MRLPKTATQDFRFLTTSKSMLIDDNEQQAAWCNKMLAEAAADRRLNIFLGTPLHYHVEDSSSTAILP